MHEIEIKSADSAAKLLFSKVEGDYFVVSYVSQDILLSRRVWGYTDCEPLVDLFYYMARQWKGWDGEVSWGSLDGEFIVTATSDKKGHISLRVKLSQTETRETWQAEATLNLESGILERASHQVKAFFLGL